jgi:chromosome segregation ATPase
MSAQLKTLNSDLNEALETEKEFQERVSGLENEIRDRQAFLEQVQADLAKETADRQLAEKQIEAAAEMSAELAHYQKAFADSRQSFDQTQSELQSQIEQNRRDIEERDSRLQRESEARVQLEQAVESARKQIREMEQKNTIEVSKLRSELQSESMERRRLESDAVNSRYVRMNNNRSGQAMVNGLRRQLQTPVEQLMSSARQMLEFELLPELKQVAEGVLEKALALQASVRETDTVQVSVNDADAAEDQSNEKPSE